LFVSFKDAGFKDFANQIDLAVGLRDYSTFYN